MILTLKGSYSPSSSSPVSSGAQGLSLHGTVSIASPEQGFPSPIGGTHFLCKVLVPPPHLRVQVDQSYKGTQYPSSSTLGGSPVSSILMGSPSGPVA